MTLITPMTTMATTVTKLEEHEEDGMRVIAALVVFTSVQLWRLSNAADVPGYVSDMSNVWYSK